MDATDVADQIREAVEEERAHQRDVDRFRTGTAMAIALLAMLLAIASLGGDNASKEMVNSNIQASDSWAFYQAKNIRQTGFRIAADELELLAGNLPTEPQSAARKTVADYRATVQRYESEPDPSDPTNPLKGEGKKELQARAQDWEAKRDRAQRQDPNFDYSQALFQIAIVLGSVSIVATSRKVLALSLVLGAVAVVLMLNGFLLLFDLPIG